MFQLSMLCASIFSAINVILDDNDFVTSAMEVC